LGKCRVRLIEELDIRQVTSARMSQGISPGAQM
jgi:hypothetical protein